jgi:branched-chain amino acid transport system permease protein
MSYGVRDRLLNVERPGILAGLGFVALLLAPLVLPPFQINLLTRTLIFAVFATAFNLLYGYTGLLSFGHAMFVAVAGYAVAKFVHVISPALGFPELFGGTEVLATFFGALVFGVIAATLLAIFVGYLSVQLQEIYFAMITLSFSMAIYVIALQDIGGLTQGSDGLTFLLGNVDLFGFEFILVNIRNPVMYYIITVFLFAGAMYALLRIVRSPFGMICTAIRENPDRAEALGIDVTRHSWVTFIISGAFSGLAGAILIPLSTNVNPSFAYWTFSAEPVIMTVIGGPYSFLGPMVGAFTYEYLRWFISQFEVLEANWQFTFGFILLIVVLFFNNGVAGGFERIRARLGSGDTAEDTDVDADAEAE